MDSCESHSRSPSLETLMAASNGWSSLGAGDGRMLRFGPVSLLGTCFELRRFASCGEIDAEDASRG